MDFVNDCLPEKGHTLQTEVARPTHALWPMSIFLKNEFFLQMKKKRVYLSIFQYVWTITRCLFQCKPPSFVCLKIILLHVTLYPKAQSWVLTKTPNKCINALYVLFKNWIWFLTSDLTKEAFTTIKTTSSSIEYIWIRPLSCFVNLILSKWFFFRLYNVLHFVSYILVY